MRYQVLTAGKRTEITDLENKVRIAIFEKDNKLSTAGTAYCLVTQYRIKGGFVPEKMFIFQTMAVAELEVVNKRSISFF